MKVVIAGGRGFLGTALAGFLGASQHHVTILSRKPDLVPQAESLDVVGWDGKTPGPWARCVDGADAVVNLAGEPIADKRWTAARKEALTRSRIDSTRAIVSAIRESRKKPPVLLSASGVGFYGDVEEGDVFEDDESGDDFLARLCRNWEDEASRASADGVRVVNTRIGIVLSTRGGALTRILLPFRMFAGGTLGSGRQWFPWIHLDDLIGIIVFSMTQSLSGPVNCASPQPVRMREFCEELGKSIRRPSWAPVPSLVLRAALGEMSSVILTGQKVMSRKLAGYDFRYPALTDALLALFPPRRPGVRS